MSAEERIVVEVAAALEREKTVNLHRFPLQLEYAEQVLTMEGEVEDIMAKKRALEVAAAIPGVSAIVDRLRLTSAEAMEDGEIRDRVCRVLLAENLLSGCAIHAMVKGKPEVVRDTDDAVGDIEVTVANGIVTLNGAVPSHTAKRLAGVLVWWVPGTRDTVNGLEVSPAEEDNDDEVVDAVRLALEKDPFVDASRVRVSCSGYVVTLVGTVGSAAQRRMAEADAWYVFQVDRVENRLLVQA